MKMINLEMIKFVYFLGIYYQSAIFGVWGEGAPERFSPNYPSSICHFPFHSQLTAHSSIATNRQ
jgi:hypothetical protein